MAIFRHISAKLVLVLGAGQADGKKVTKRVTISNIREDASTDALWELAEAMGMLLAYPVAEVRLYKVEAVEREDGDEEVDENGGVNKDADTDVALAGGDEALPAFVSHGGRLSEEKAALAREAYGFQADSRGEHTQLLPPLRETEAAAVFPGTDTRMNSPPLSRGSFIASLVMPGKSVRKNAKKHGAEKYLRFFVR